MKVWDVGRPVSIQRFQGKKMTPIPKNATAIKNLLIQPISVQGFSTGFFGSCLIR